MSSTFVSFMIALLIGLVCVVLGIAAVASPHHGPNPGAGFLLFGIGAVIAVLTGWLSGGSATTDSFPYLHVTIGDVPVWAWIIMIVAFVGGCIGGVILAQAH